MRPLVMGPSERAPSHVSFFVLSPHACLASPLNTHAWHPPLRSPPSPLQAPVRRKVDMDAVAPVGEEDERGGKKGSAGTETETKTGPREEAGEGERERAASEEAERLRGRAALCAAQVGAVMGHREAMRYAQRSGQREGTLPVLGAAGIRKHAVKG